MEFPYGLSDFGTLIGEGCFYQDRTDRIPQLEKAGRQLIFVRPRRFGRFIETRYFPAKCLSCVGIEPQHRVAYRETAKISGAHSTNRLKTLL